MSTRSSRSSAPIVRSARVGGERSWRRRRDTGAWARRAEPSEAVHAHQRQHPHRQHRRVFEAEHPAAFDHGRHRRRRRPMRGGGATTSGAAEVEAVGAAGASERSAATTIGVPGPPAATAIRWVRDVGCGASERWSTLPSMVLRVTGATADRWGVDRWRGHRRGNGGGIRGRKLEPPSRHDQVGLDEHRAIAHVVAPVELPDLGPSSRRTHLLAGDRPQRLALFDDVHRGGFGDCGRRPPPLV